MTRRAPRCPVARSIAVEEWAVSPGNTTTRQLGQWRGAWGLASRSSLDEYPRCHTGRTARWGRESWPAACARSVLLRLFGPLCHSQTRLPAATWAFGARCGYIRCTGRCIPKTRHGSQTASRRGWSTRPVVAHRTSIHMYCMYMYVLYVQYPCNRPRTPSGRPVGGWKQYYRTPSSMASEIGGGVWLAMPGAAARQVRLVGNPRPDKVHTLRNVDSDPPRSNSGPTRPVDRQSTRLSPR